MTIEATYKVVGMSCQSCATSVQTLLEHVPGVEKAEVHFSTSEVQVRHDPEKAPFEQLKAALEPAGYTLLVDTRAQIAAQKAYLARLRRALALAGLFAMGGLVLHFTHAHLPLYTGALFFLLSLPVVVGTGQHFFRPAWQQLRVRQLTMDTLISLGLVGSLALGLFELIQGKGGYAISAATEILFFVLVGRYLEERARYRTQTVLESLSTLAAPTARRVSPEPGTVLTPSLAPGEVVEVWPGETFPIDGEITEGHSYADESLLTGESLPVEKSPGHRVWAGTRNLSQPVQVRVAVPASETFLAKLIERLQKAQRSQARVQRLADRVSAVFVPVVLVLAAFTVGYHLWRGADAAFAWERALSVLVISCPCALGLATPLAVQMAIGGAAQKQLLLREVSQLENLPAATVWAFDKTGTLTLGKAAVQHADWKDPQYAGKLAFLLRRSTHPLAQALADHLATFAEPEPVKPLTWVELPGKGLIITLPGEKLYVGSPRWLTEKHPDLPVPEATAVAVATDQHIIGVFTFSDPVRTALKPFLARLQIQGKKCVLLTGDPSPVADQVARELGLDAVWKGLSPLEKARWIEAQQSAGEKVAFVGDGLNDVLALQTAWAGIAVYRSAGAAAHSAGIALLQDTETALPALYQLSLRLRRIVAQNLAWAFGYNLVALPLAMGLFSPYYVSPSVSALLMSLSSLTVVLNSLRLSVPELKPSPAQGRPRTKSGSHRPEGAST